jgi:membrane-bound lytic murein transglycosylase B
VLDHATVVREAEQMDVLDGERLVRRRHAGRKAAFMRPMHRHVRSEWGTYETDGDHNGHKDPHDPFDAIPGAAKVLRQGKGMPAAPAPLPRIREAVRAYNGSGSMVEAYADRVMADASRYGLKSAQPQGVGTDNAAAAAQADAEPRRGPLRRR